MTPFEYIIMFPFAGLFWVALWYLIQAIVDFVETKFERN